MRRFRVSDIQWDAQKKLTYKKIPNVIWFEFSEKTQDTRCFIENLLYKRFKIKPISFRYSDVTANIDITDMDMDEILRGMTPQD